MAPAELSEEIILARLAAQPVAGMRPESHPAGLRDAAVLVPLIMFEDRWQLLLTRRTETVQSHKGQVSFPGGAADPTDRSPEETALREANEEIGLLPADVKLLGRLPSMVTISNYLVTPVIGCIRWPYRFVLSPPEVSRVFTIPLDWLAQPENREERPRILPNGVTEDIVYYQSYEGEVLWGISGRITVELLRVLDLI